MRNNVVASTFLVIALLAEGRQADAQAFMVGFDTDPSGNPIVAGSVLSNVYHSMGLTFVLPAPGGTCGTQVYASDDHPGDFGSLPNLVTTCPAGTSSAISEDSGFVEVILANPAIRVCIEVRPDNPGSAEHRAVLRAYDSGGNLIDEAHSGPGVIETICVRGYRISSARFSGEGDHRARFDNLSLAFSGGLVPPTTVYLPGAANLPGLGGTTWKTAVDIHNRGSFDLQATVALLQRDQENSNPREIVFTAWPGENLHWDNPLQAIFSYSGAATLRVTGVGGSLLASSRTYSDDAAGSYGQYVAGAALDDAIVPGQTATLIGLSESTDPNTGFRTNLGLVSASEFGITVLVDLFLANADFLGPLTYDLEAFESIQINRVFAEVSGGNVDAGYAEVSSATPESLFFAFAAVVDNRSGDSIYIPARQRGDL